MRQQARSYHRLFIFLAISIFLGSSIYSQRNANQITKISNIKANANSKSSAQKWREDLEFIKRELPAKHKDLFHRLDRDRFYKEVAELDKNIPDLTPNQVALEFERIVGLAKDGHTWTSPVFTRSMNFQAFPVNFYMFGDNIYIRKADPTYKDIVGGKVLKIGNMTTAEAYKKVSPYMSTDNEMGIKDVAPSYLTSPEILRALGISDSLEKVSLEIEKDGKVFTKEIKLLPNKDNSIRAVRGAMRNWADANANAKTPTPLSRKHPYKKFWFEYLQDKKLLYVQLNNVLNDKDKTLAQFFKEVFDFANKNELDKFVLDIRHNGGGNNTLIKPIIRGIIKLDEIDRPGHFFVIIGRETFSAAQNLTNELENWTKVTFVGEPTASHVNLYGDARRFELPNSKMPIFISELWWQNKHARDERKWTGPHLFTPQRFADYQNNIDPAMKAIEGFKPLKPLREMAIEAVKNNQVKAFLSKAKERLTRPIYKFQGSEDEINNFGYNLLAMKKVDDAVATFELNAELYPKSYNVYDSLAEAYLRQGKKELAIEFYKKSLEVNPNNTNATQMVEKIRTTESAEKASSVNIEQFGKDLFAGEIFRGSFAPDGKTFYFFRKIKPRTENYRIFESNLVIAKWTVPKLINLGGEFSDLYPSISKDGKRMVFASYRPAPNDKSEKPNAHLWYVDKKSDGSWGKPVFLSRVNKFGHYHSWVEFGWDNDIYFRQTTPDWKNTRNFVTRWNGKEYVEPVAFEKTEIWKKRYPQINIKGISPGPNKNIVLLDVPTKNPKTGRNAADIWFSIKQNGKWTKPKPFSKQINEDGCELHPFSYSMRGDWA